MTHYAEPEVYYEVGVEVEKVTQCDVVSLNEAFQLFIQGLLLWLA